MSFALLFLHSSFCIEENCYALLLIGWWSVKSFIILQLLFVYDLLNILPYFCLLLWWTFFYFCSTSARYSWRGMRQWGLLRQYTPCPSMTPLVSCYNVLLLNDTLNLSLCLMYSTESPLIVTFHSWSSPSMLSNLIVDIKGSPIPFIGFHPWVKIDLLILSTSFYNVWKILFKIGDGIWGMDRNWYIMIIFPLKKIVIFGILKNFKLFILLSCIS